MVLKALFGVRTTLLKGKLTLVKGFRKKLDKLNRARADAIAEQNVLEKKITKARKSKLSKAQMSTLMARKKKNNETRSVLKSELNSAAKGLAKISLDLGRQVSRGRLLTSTPKKRRRSTKKRSKR